MFRAITVCVEFGDILALTLPHNRHHFSDVMVVTTPTDDETQRVARENGAQVYITETFYDRGAHFNKWAALEEGLSTFGRKGLMTILDVDVLWPSDVLMDYQMGVLYSPYRYIWDNIQSPIPPEEEWEHLPIYGDYEHAGYTQIFHGEDRHLPAPPWHELNWSHAGGGDSGFQNLWPAHAKFRPHWRVLHLGRPGRNWAGRTTVRLDGRLSPQAGHRRAILDGLMRARVANRGYRAERLP